MLGKIHLRNISLLIKENLIIKTILCDNYLYISLNYNRQSKNEDLIWI